MPDRFEEGDAGRIDQNQTDCFGNDFYDRNFRRKVDISAEYRVGSAPAPARQRTPLSRRLALKSDRLRTKDLDQILVTKFYSILPD